jgi:hypothetical protein
MACNERRSIGQRDVAYASHVIYGARDIMYGGGRR